MPSHPMPHVSPLLSVLVFIAVILLFEGLYLMWMTYRGPQAKKLERRLSALSSAPDAAAQAALLRERMMSELPPFQRMLLRLPHAHQLDRFLLQANLDWTVSKLLLGCAALGAGVYLAVTALLHQPFVIGALAGAGAAALPLAWVRRRRAKRLAQLELQLPDALDLLARALRVPVTDLRYFVVAVLIQRETGGNLTEVLTNLSGLIRQRLKLMWHVRVLSAEGRMSAWLLSLLPFAIGGLMSVFNPEFMAPLWNDPLGVSIVRGMLVSMFFGVLMLRKIIRIRV